MDTPLSTKRFSFKPIDTERLLNLCGQLNEHLQQIEKYFGVKINHRGDTFQISGPTEAIHAASNLLDQLYQETLHEKMLTPAKIHLFLTENNQTGNNKKMKQAMDANVIHTKRTKIKPRGHNQIQYINNIRDHDINFAIGPAGTGKTYLAVACALEALDGDKVQRLILVRPAVEAGEKLGFLPGDMAEKIHPYLKPLYDALYEMSGFETITKLIEQNIIEVAPLAFMRGRTLNDSFVILDEAQNTTIEQMKMFLTRIGFGSTAVITGDITQVDLPKHTPSGLNHAMDVLKNIKDISFSHFEANDAVRHSLVQSIIQAYAKHDEQKD